MSLISFVDFFFISLSVFVSGWLFLDFVCTLFFRFVGGLFFGTSISSFSFSNGVFFFPLSSSSFSCSFGTGEAPVAGRTDCPTELRDIILLRTILRCRCIYSSCGAKARVSTRHFSALNKSRCSK
ncbi:hypothetical protein FKM82_017497 [Ascaphus truei]